jgi:quercetin dioxygenase-like cupin family protein
MRHVRDVSLAVLFAVAALVLTAGTAQAQDPVKVAPKNFKVLLDNEHVRVLEFHSNAGEKIPMHSHPAYTIYSFAAGKTKYTSPTGETSEREMQAGQAVWRDAESHASEFMGPGEAHSLLIEMKGKPHMKTPAKKK